MLTQNPYDMLPDMKKQKPIPLMVNECDSDEHAILQALGEEKVHINEIIALTMFDMSKALAVLLTLECRQLVKQLTGMHFIRLTHAYTLKA